MATRGRAAVQVTDIVAMDAVGLAKAIRTRKISAVEVMAAYLDHIERDGAPFLAQVTQMGLEGIIAKKADAPYRAGRTQSWLKIKADA